MDFRPLLPEIRWSSPVCPRGLFTTGASRLAPHGGRRLPLRPGYPALGSSGFQIAQSPAGQFGDNRVGVAEQQNQHTDPGQFAWVYADHGNGVSHRQILLNISSDIVPED